MIRRVDVAVLPSEAEASEADCFVVVDLLRATTHIAALFGAGLSDLIAVADVDEARTAAQRDNRILLGEVGGLPPAGFDFGNSPSEVTPANVAGRGAVLFTTNGTTAICACAGQGAVFSGALVNLKSLIRHLESFEHALVVCSGLRRGTAFAVEDFVAAGVIVSRLAEQVPSAMVGDAAQAARDLASLRPPLETLGPGEHARTITDLGFGHDIEYATRESILSAAPQVVEHGEGWARLVDSEVGSA